MILAKEKTTQNKYWRKSDMKKLVSFVMAAVLCMGMATTVFAAESPAVVVTPVDGENFTVDTEVYANFTDEDVETILASYGHTPNVLASVVLEISRVDGKTDAAAVQIYVNGCVVGESWIAYVFNDETGEFDVAKATVVQGGIIEIQMPHFSDVFLVKTANAPATTTTTTNTATSPKTADAGLMLAGLAAVAATGSVVASRKVKASR